MASTASESRLRTSLRRLSVMDGLLLQMLLNPQMDRPAAFDAYLEQFLAQNAARDYDALSSQLFSDPPRRPSANHNGGPKSPHNP